MRSIRRQLTVGLLLGFAVLLGAGGAVSFLKTREMLFDQFDAALEGKALAMAGAIKQEGDKLEIEFRDESVSGSARTNLTEYYQVRIIDGPTVRKSRSLGKAELPWELGTKEVPRYQNIVLPNGRLGRAIALQFVPRLDRRGKQHVTAPEMGLVLAHDRGQLDDNIRAFGWSELVAGLVTGLATVILVSLVLRRGLAPLERLASQAEGIHAGTLGRRFPSENLPAEIEPICTRLNDLLSRLEKSFNDISEYAAKVAHELRTPLTILRLKIDQAGRNLPPELAEELEGEMHHLAHVIDQSLLIARAEHGRLQLDLEPFDLAGLVADSVEDFSLLAEDSGRCVRFTPPSPPCLAVADSRYIRQIIHNLLTNALRHGSGEIRIRLAPRGQRYALTILNGVQRHSTPPESALGLGLRVVESLLHLQPDLRFARRQGRQYYVARLTLPRSTGQSAAEPVCHSPAGSARR